MENEFVEFIESNKQQIDQIWKARGGVASATVITIHKQTIYLEGAIIKSIIFIFPYFDRSPPLLPSFLHRQQKSQQRSEKSISLSSLAHCNYVTFYIFIWKQE